MQKKGHSPLHQEVPYTNIPQRGILMDIFILSIMGLTITKQSSFFNISIYILWS